MELALNLDAWAAATFALLNVPPPEPLPNGGAADTGDSWGQAVRNFYSGLAVVAILIWTSIIAASALASLFLLWAGNRWPSFGRSIRWNAVAAVALTLAAAFIVAQVLAAAIPTDPDQSKTYANRALYISCGLAALALALQIAARGSFSPGRAAGVAVAVAILPLMLLAAQLWWT